MDRKKSHIKINFKKNHIKKYINHMKGTTLKLLMSPVEIIIYLVIIIIIVEETITTKLIQWVWNVKIQTVGGKKSLVEN